MKFGLEIELITDKQKLFKELEKNKIDYINIDKMRCGTHDILVIKPEFTIKDPNGIELNFPPNENYDLIEKVLTILNTLDVRFNNKCALHVHIDFNNHTRKDLQRLHDYYVDNQDKILYETIKKGLYLNLNDNLKKGELLTPKRRCNLNLINAFVNHGTVEHRIYKSTINFDEVKFCIEQTMKIVEESILYEQLF